MHLLYFACWYYFLMHDVRFKQKFFGTIRQAGGSNDHPDTPTFLQLYKILSTYSILKPPTTGNCTVVDDTPNEPLITITTIKEIYSNPEKTHLLSFVKEKLNYAIEHTNWDFEDFVEHDYSLPEITDCVIYYVTGYLIKQLMKSVHCDSCKAAFINPVTHANAPVAKMTNMKTRGGLLHPNLKFFNFIKSLETLFQKHCNKNDVFELVLEDALQSNILQFPCRDHYYDILPYCIQYYVRMRMRQYTRTLNRQQKKANQLNKKKSKFCST